MITKYLERLEKFEKKKKKVELEWKKIYDFFIDCAYISLIKNCRKMEFFILSFSTESPPLLFFLVSPYLCLL